MVYTLPKTLSTKNAVEALHSGECIIFPTETFFALGCKISHTQAVQQIFIAKQRPIHMPLPVIISNKKQLLMIAHVPDVAIPLLEYFWPGPLTIIFNATKHVPKTINAHTNTIAVRISSHPLASQLTQLAGEPLVATSANIHKTQPVTKISKLDPKILIHIKGIISKPPQPHGGLPSTIITIQNDGGLTILRNGAITKQQITALLQKEKQLYFKY